MKLNKFLICGLTALSILATSCQDKEEPVQLFSISLNSTLPEGAVLDNVKCTFTEINTGATTTVTDLSEINLPTGVYNVEAEATATITGVEKHLRSVAQNITINESQKAIDLTWFFYNPENSLIFSEIFVAGSLRADGKAALYDSYFLIYNNTDEVIYADGLILCESKLLNSSFTDLRTEANFPDNNFTAQVLYAIPGSGKDVPIQPGKSIKIVDQAANFNNPAEGMDGVDNTDADFEWYDEVTTGTIRDTDNPSVKNLEKIYSYSKTIWLPSQQCNRSYAIFRLPEGMDTDTYLSKYNGDYDYISVVGTAMKGTNCYLVPNEWILDGVNLCPSSLCQFKSLGASVDMSFSAVAADNALGNRAGKKFVRKVAGTSPLGNQILQDTNDSANDFEVVKVK